MNKRPGGVLSGISDDLSKSILLPISSKWRELGRKAFFWPMACTVVYVVAMPFLMDNFETTATVRVHDQHPRCG
jgi:hypothetical protein